MNQERLRIYLEDHAAIMVGERELIRRCYENNPDSRLGEYLQNLEQEVSLQQTDLESVAQSQGIENGWSSQLKSGAAWIAEKLGRLKPNDRLSEYSDLSRLVELESLLATVAQRRLFWESIAALQSLHLPASVHPDTHLKNCRAQIEQLETYHRSAAALAFLKEE